MEVSRSVGSYTTIGTARYTHAGGRTSTSQAEETIDGSHLGRSQSHPTGRPGKSTVAEHQDQQRRGLRWRRPAGRISAHGQCDKGERLRDPRQGRCLGCVRPSKRRDGGARRPANAAGRRRGGGGHIIMGQGAVPIIRNGVVDGACGVSGGIAQQDEDCSPAGVAQL